MTRFTVPMMVLVLIGAVLLVVLESAGIIAPAPCSAASMTDARWHFSCVIPDDFQSSATDQLPQLAEATRQAAAEAPLPLAAWRTTAPETTTVRGLAVSAFRRTPGNPGSYVEDMRHKLLPGTIVRWDDERGAVFFDGPMPSPAEPLAGVGYAFVGAYDIVTVVCFYPAGRPAQATALLGQVATSFKFDPGYGLAGSSSIFPGKWTIGTILSFLIYLAIWIPMARSMRRQKALEQAAAGGDVYAMCALAAQHEKRARRKDLQKALLWYHKTATADDAVAMNSLATFYAEGRGTALDYRQAVVWFRKAAEAGNADGMYNLGAAYGNGQGVSQDEQEALAWFQKAAALGHANAQQALADMGNPQT